MTGLTRPQRAFVLASLFALVLVFLLALASVDETFGATAVLSVERHGQVLKGDWQVSGPLEEWIVTPGMIGFNFGLRYTPPTVPVSLVALSPNWTPHLHAGEIDSAASIVVFWEGTPEVPVPPNLDGTAFEIMFANGAPDCTVRFINVQACGDFDCYQTVVFRDCGSTDVAPPGPWPTVWSAVKGLYR